MKKRDLISALDGGDDCDLNEVWRHSQMTRARLIREIECRVKYESLVSQKPCPKGRAHRV